jgi:hypothetical protein
MRPLDTAMSNNTITIVLALPRKYATKVFKKLCLSTLPYIYMYICLSLSLPLSISIYTYIPHRAFRHSGVNEPMSSQVASTLSVPSLIKVPFLIKRICLVWCMISNFSAKARSLIAGCLPCLLACSLACSLAHL